MSFEFNCIHCNCVLEADKSMIESKLSCPNCGNIVTVPKKKVIKSSIAKYEKFKYPVLCIITGAILIIFSILNLISLTTSRLRFNNLTLQQIIHILNTVLFFTTGLSLLFKKKMGVIGSYAILVLYSISIIALFALKDFNEIPNSVKFPLLIFLCVIILIIFSAFAFNTWQQKNKKAPLITNCPNCKTKNYLTNTESKNNCVCDNCQVVFQWKFFGSKR